MRSGLCPGWFGPRPVRRVSSRGRGGFVSSWAGLVGWPPRVALDGLVGWPPRVVLSGRGSGTYFLSFWVEPRQWRGTRTSCVHPGCEVLRLRAFGASLGVTGRSATGIVCACARVTRIIGPIRDLGSKPILSLARNKQRARSHPFVGFYLDTGGMILGVVAG